VDIIDPEFAMVFGPFSMQAEYIYAMVHDVENYQTGAPLSKTQSNASFYGWYAQASYFLTGEHRNYAKTASPATYQETFGRVYPNHNFDPRACGLGAWELAFRISQLDVNDFNAGFFGGMETDITAGLNWYLNPNVMVKMNFVHAMVDAHSQGNSTANYYGLMPTSGTDNIFETRFQIAF
jgi:phosphate-selective porin OprO/OprP